MKLLGIVGSTGTGKTALAIHIARMYPSVLISADSRQVYRGMDVVTGKDHPTEVELGGIDICDPDADCSVSTWYDAVSPQIDESKLTIAVGGTGLYVRALTDGIETMKIPPNENLRSELEKISVAELQNRLNKVNSLRYESMNNSDRNNPRRLIRAIEVAYSDNLTRLPDHTIARPNSLLIGLHINDVATYRELVRSRVVERLQNGAVDETRRLITKYDKTLPSMTAIGYRSITRFLSGEITETELIDVWTEDELRYAKRQMTWFRKVEKVMWFDPAETEYMSQVAQLVSSWYD